MSKHQKKKTKKNSLPVIIAVVVVVALAAGFGAYAIVSRNKAQAPKVELSPLFEGAMEMLDNGNPSAVSDASSADAESGEDASGTSLGDGESPGVSGEMSESGGEGGGLVGYTVGLPGSGGQSGGTGHSAPGGELIPVDIPTISFPYSIPGTNLIVNQLSPYSGYFIEDGSDQGVSGIAAIVLTNNGGDLDFVGIGISQGDRSLAFSASQIPAGATVIIQEQNKAAYDIDDYYSCTATTTESSGFDLAKDKLVIEELNNGSFQVANITEETIPEVKIYFKNYLSSEDVYVGGITYSVTLTDIEPQTAVSVNSSHYDASFSEIVDVEIGK